ncbi:hypothetical protein VNI00_012120 [Paramarasmius palmivorus]|uniref:MYND-type domain-containing protein n=1 Tax=Paramarasmius palmivorus TaxID=297713 RepID=A0AAW0C8H4_9AGAR
MPSSRTCHPCLPPDLLAELEADPNVLTENSYIYKPVFEEFRREVLELTDARPSVESEVVDTVAPRSIDRNTDISRFPPSFRRITERLGSISSFQKGEKKTLLHAAAIDGDLALAYEIIRMGIDIDRKDKNGCTALFHSLVDLMVLCQNLEEVNKLDLPQLARRAKSSLPKTFDTEYLTKRIASQTRIATLLIEQHADVNVGVFGVTPIIIAIESSRWGIVELLLRHGASLPQTSDAEDKPYPDHFVCNCGKKNKSFGECCGRRNFKVLERWDPVDKWIMRMKIQTMPTRIHEIYNDGPPIGPPGMDLLTRLNNDDTRKTLSELSVPANKVAFLQGVLTNMGMQDRVDPAHWYALARVDFNPGPWDKQISKLECQKRMHEWNDAVDEYIATQRDPRPRLDIEVAVKIAMSGSPLYKTCQAEGCNKAEKRDVQTLSRCSGCKVTSYCSRECQKRAWSGHKGQCKKGLGEAQARRTKSMLATDQAMEQYTLAVLSSTGGH